MFIVDLCRAFVEGLDTLLDTIGIWAVRNNLREDSFVFLIRNDQLDVVRVQFPEVDLRVVPGIDINNFSAQAAIILPGFVTLFIQNDPGDDPIYFTSFVGQALDSVTRLRSPRVAQVISLGDLRREVYGASKVHTETAHLDPSRLNRATSIVESLAGEGYFQHGVRRTDFRAILSFFDGQFSQNYPGETSTIIDQLIQRGTLVTDDQGADERLFSDPKIRQHHAALPPIQDVPKLHQVASPATWGKIYPSGIQPNAEGGSVRAELPEAVSAPSESNVRESIRSHLRALSLGSFRTMREDLYASLDSTLNDNSESMLVTDLISIALTTFEVGASPSYKDEVERREKVGSILRHLRVFLFTVLSNARVLLDESGNTVYISRHYGISNTGIPRVSRFSEEWKKTCDKVIIHAAFETSQFSHVSHLEDVVLEIYPRNRSTEGRKIVEECFADWVVSGRIKLDEITGNISKVAS